MSVSRFEWDGLAELREALRHLPEALAGEAADIVESAANSAVADVRAAYPTGPTGTLLKRLEMTFTRSRFGTVAIVRNKAPHSHLYERGTKDRRYTTKRGNDHRTGVMPAAHVFIPVMQRRRREMYARLRELLVRHGLIVSET